MIRSRRAVALVSIAIAPTVAAIMACSSEPSGGGRSVPDSEAGGGGDALVPDATANDAPSATDAPNGTCVGACKDTVLVADFGGKTRTLSRSQHGIDTGEGGAATFHVESHLGGSPACPSQTSPTPDYTLVTSGVPRGKAGAKVSERDGVTGAFFDFKGDLGLPPITKAISVSVSVVAEDSATPPAWVAMDVEAYFREGSVKGHVYATHCDSLD